MAKAQSSIAEYVFTIFFGILVVVSITALVYSFYRTAIEHEVKAELNQLAVQTSDSIVKLYEVSKNSEAQPSNYSSILISEMDLKLPVKVAKKNYEILLVSSSSIWTYVDITIDGQNISTVKKTPGAKIVARTTQTPVTEIEFDIPNVDIFVQGKVENGINGTLKYFRYNDNTTIYDSIILGDSEILARITVVN